jgi:inner membrane protein
MPSLGHIAVGMAAARVHHDGRLPRLTALAAWSALSLLPDIDVVGFPLGVAYSAPFGHRGATHSLFASVLGGLAVGVLARLRGYVAGRPTVMASVVLASHAFLDTMTDGGFGCALLWPFTSERYFAPWRPIPVAPIGRDFLSADGAFVALAELVMFCPLIVYAVARPHLSRRAVAGSLAIWVAAAAAVADTSIRDGISGRLLGDDTRFDAGFSEAAFRRVAPGDSQDDVIKRLGAPRFEFWFFGPPDERGPDERPAPEAGCVAIRFERGLVAGASDADDCRRAGVWRRQTASDVGQQLGQPTESCWQYTWSPSGRRHRIRVVCFVNGAVGRTIRRWS